jgi:hypothetical protein
VRPNALYAALKRRAVVLAPRSRDTGMNSERSSFGLASVGRALARRDRVEDDLEGDQRPFGVALFRERAG